MSEANNSRFPVGRRPIRDWDQQVVDALLLTLAPRNGLRLVTFESGVAALAGPDVELLKT